MKTLLAVALLMTASVAPGQHTCVACLWPQTFSCTPETKLCPSVACGANQNQVINGYQCTRSGWVKLLAKPDAQEQKASSGPRCAGNQHIENGRCADDPPVVIIPKCGKYQHLEHDNGVCINKTHDGFEKCDIKPDKCIDDVHILTEKDWQNLMAILNKLAARPCRKGPMMGSFDTSQPCNGQGFADSQP